VALHGLSDHLPEFLDGLTLGGDGMAKRGGDIASVRLVFMHLEDDLRHVSTG